MSKAKIPKVSIGDMLNAFVYTTPKETRVSDQYHKLRSCLSKKSHTTIAKAAAAVNEANKSNNGEYEYYRCKYCPCWHVGHIPKQ